jgi:carbon starvation protein CstA
MITFSISVIVLILGYFFYGKLTEKIFGADINRTTPAYRLQDNIDYVPMKKSKSFLIQFLDIAGLGPIFGAILGATYGPIAFVWIVLGAIFGGAVHDYMSGMMSVRQNGESIAEVIGKWLGLSAKQFMRMFTLFLMILVGAAFITGPAAILSSKVQSLIDNNVLGGFWNFFTKKYFWIVIILLYYFAATLLPIDKIIGKIYPFFGFALLFMAAGIGIALFFYSDSMPELTLETFRNLKTNPDDNPVFPLIFITISCGAISGFHSTQSPLIARTLKNEKDGRQIFYGAMITESLMALIWAAAAMTFFGGVGALNMELAAHDMQPAWFVNLISNNWLGLIGGILAVLGVIAAPITTGDTALRSARLIVSDFTKIKQNSFKNRILITIIIFAVVYGFTLLKFDILWRLMFWFNQVLATIVLWGITVYLAKKHKFFWISLVPAVFMTYVVTAYLFIAKETLNMNSLLSNSIGIILSIFILAYFLFLNYSKYRKQKPEVD